jgi:fumarate reductase (CoM/CoB) subunit A
MDYRKSDFIVSPVAHFHMGGIKINEKCETTLQGLYACGEVTGGVHGANRLANNAHTETIVFGARAGKNAAEWAKATRGFKENEEEFNSVARGIRNIGGGEKNLHEIKRVFQEAMWKNVGLVRERSSLEEALSIINEQFEVMRDIKAETSIDITETLELFNMLKVGKMITHAALTRTESRGAHYRSDHQHRDDRNWLKNIISYRDEKGEAKVKLRDIVVSD